MSESLYTRGIASETGILATQPVSASEWIGAARLRNHIVGRGRVLVPAFCSPTAKLPVGRYAYAIRIIPSYNALVRQWHVSARVDGGLKFDVNGAAIGIGIGGSGSGVGTRVGVGSRESEVGGSGVRCRLPSKVRGSSGHEQALTRKRRHAGPPTRRVFGVLSLA